MIICPLNDTEYFWQMCGGKIETEGEGPDAVLRCLKCGAIWTTESKEEQPEEKEEKLSWLSSESKS